MPDHQKLMTPVLFKAILFLKYNERLWDARFFSKAIQDVTDDQVEANTRST